MIEYNYERNGQIVLPAGSRAIGRINNADTHGNMAISFDSVDLPNGSSVPISAVAVDTNLRSLKGQVTGSSRGKPESPGNLVRHQIQAQSNDGRF